uniref:Uncharacterized protein n=1 Tax=Arundo donax TaxID=35708 RepID=A0A0A9AYN5_ARUDO
MARDGPAPST